MRHVFLLIITVLVLTSCNKNRGRDPLLGFKMGVEKNKWEIVLNNLIKKGVLIEDEYGGYRAYIFDGVDSFRVEYTINEPYPSSKFNEYIRSWRPFKYFTVENIRGIISITITSHLEPT